ncbi:MAG: phosphoribosylanthranilate isomerase [Terracidiphilus sp.]|jgi:phosphoribosylanthranilate isomerase
MSLWIKICANTSLADAQLAAEAGADAVGFVFAPSPRRVTPEQVAKIAPHLPAALEKIGVFVDAGFEEIAATIEAAGLTGVQLHFDAPAALSTQLRERFGPKLRILGVVRFGAQPQLPILRSGDNFDREAAMRIAEEGIGFAAPFLDQRIDAILVDSYSLITRGGTGNKFDWGLAAVTLFKVTSKNKIAAGGLTPENVAEAIAILRPWGADVVSGVELAPGRKDPAKVRAFIANARAAEM